MKILIKNLLLIIFVSLISLSFKPNEVNNSKSDINWMTWEQVQEAQKEDPRKVFVDVYTHWCVWCKRMDAKTFHDPKIVEYINANYYAVKFNAEMREAVVFKGEKFHYVKKGSRGYNELATELLEGTMSFPTTVYLDKNLDVLTSVGGYLEPKELDPILSFFATDSHLKQKWSQYQTNYKSIL